MSKNGKALPAPSKETPLDNRIKSKTIDDVVKRLSSTDLGRRCTPLTINRLRRFLAATDVPESVLGGDERNGAYVFYTAQGYLNGIVSSTSKFLSDSPKSSMSSRCRDFIGSVLLSDSKSDVLKTLGDLRPMTDAFTHGYDDGLSIMSSHGGRTAMSVYSATFERRRMIDKHTTSALCSLMEGALYSCDIDADEQQSQYSDAAALVGRLVAEELGERSVRRRIGVGSKAAQRLGIRTNTLTHAVRASVKDVVSFVDGGIMPMMRICRPDSPSVSMSTICFAYGDIHYRLRRSGEYDALRRPTKRHALPRSIVASVRRHTEALPSQTADEILGYMQDVYDITDGTAEDKDGYIVMCDGMSKAAADKRDGKHPLTVTHSKKEGLADGRKPEGAYRRHDA